MPSWWRLERVDLRASANEGDSTEPRWTQHFRVDLTPREELYVADGRHTGTFEVLIPARAASETYRLYGVARSRLEAGQWVMDLDMGRLDADLGKPRSQFSDQAVAVATADPEATRRLLDEVADDLSEAVVDVDLLRRFADEAAETLATANRQRLQALREQYEEEHAAVRTAGERERAALEQAHRARHEALQAALAARGEEMAKLAAEAEAERARFIEGVAGNLDALHARGRKELAAVAESEVRLRASLEHDHRTRLEELRARIAEVSAEITAKVVAAEAERSRLVAEHEEDMARLRAQYEERRMAAGASSDTLLALRRAQARAAAQRELVPVLQALLRERKRVAESAAAGAAADLASRESWYAALLRGLGSEAITDRQAALDLAITNEDDGLRTMAFVIARVSDDETMYSRALETAFSSGNRALQLAAVHEAFAYGGIALKSKVIDWVLASSDEQLVARLPRISQWAARVVQFSAEGKSRQTAQAALGPPETSSDGTCERGLPSWYPGRDRGEQYIRVAFAKPVRMPEIVVHETGTSVHSAGFVRKLILWDTGGNSVEYRVEDELRRCPGASRFELHRHTAAVVGVTVVIDVDYVSPLYAGIDAIQLVGVPLE